MNGRIFEVHVQYISEGAAIGQFCISGYLKIEAKNVAVVSVMRKHPQPSHPHSSSLQLILIKNILNYGKKQWLEKKYMS